MVDNAEADALVQKLGLTEEEASRGQRFEIVPDEEDPRWQWVRIRQIRASNEVVRAVGQEASNEISIFMIDSAAGVVGVFARSLPPQIVKGLSLHAVVRSLDALASILGEVLPQIGTDERKP